jgi:hypothetical protein
VANAVVKAAWLLVGVLLVFSTRDVSESFNESKAIALAIYNAVVALGLIAALLELVNGVGDTRSMLLLFGLAWVAYFTLGVLTVPKLLQFSAVQKRAAAAISPRQADAGPPDKIFSAAIFSFVPVEQLGSAATVHTYVVALEHHLADARAHLARVSAGKKKAVQFGVGSPSLASRSVTTKIAVRAKGNQQTE